jgi:hypothetical protein
MSALISVRPLIQQLDFFIGYTDVPSAERDSVDFLMHDRAISVIPITDEVRSIWLRIWRIAALTKIDKASYRIILCAEPG